MGTDLQESGHCSLVAFERVTVIGFRFRLFFLTTEFNFSTYQRTTDLLLFIRKVLFSTAGEATGLPTPLLGVVTGNLFRHLT